MLTDDEVERLADEVPPRYRALVLMLTETGARPGEAIALRVKNLNGSVRIAEATVEVRGKKITGTPKTKAASATSLSPPGCGRHSGTTTTGL